MASASRPAKRPRTFVSDATNPTAHTTVTLPPNTAIGGTRTVPYTPIAKLRPPMRKWSILARVVKRTAPTAWSKDGRTGSRFTAELIDDAGTEISATFLNSASKLAGLDEHRRPENLVKQGSTYVFSNGIVQDAYMPTPTEPFALCIGDYSSIVPSLDREVPPVPVHIMPITALYSAAVNATVSVLAIIEQARPLETKQLSSGTRSFREVMLTDATDSIPLTLWGSDAEMLPADPRGKPLLVHRACVGDTFGIKHLTAFRRTVLHPEPTHPGTVALLDWWKAEAATCADPTLTELHPPQQPPLASTAAASEPEPQFSPLANTDDEMEYQG